MNQVKDSILSLVKKVESPDQLLKKLRQKLDFSDSLIWIVVFFTGFINNFYFILSHWQKTNLKLYKNIKASFLYHLLFQIRH